MKKAFTLVITLLLGATLTFAQDACKGGCDKRDTKKVKSVDSSKGHKDGKKGKKGGNGTTTPPPK